MNRWRSPTLGLLSLLLGGCGSSPGIGPAATLSIVSGGRQTAEVGAELPEAVVVRVTDGDGTAVPNQMISFVVVSGGGSLSGGTTQTDAQGESRVQWTLGTGAGEQVIEARAVDQSTGAPVVVGRATATAVPGPVVELTTRPGLSPIFLGRTLDVASVVEATDQYGNIVTDPPVTLSAGAPFHVEGTRLSSSAEAGGSITLTSGAVSVSRHVTALRHLDELVGGAGGWTCTGRAPYHAGLVMTHQSTDFTVDSVHYSIESPLFVAHPEIFITISTASTLEDGSTRRSSGQESALHAVQTPGKLHWSFPEGPLVGSATLTRNSPLSYSGGTDCYGWVFTDSEPLTMHGP